MNEEIKKGRWVVENRLRCIFCGSTNDLAMFAQRPENGGDIVGWIYICEECYKKGESENINVKYAGGVELHKGKK